MKESINVVKKQLQLVEKADLSQFNQETQTYFIPKRKDIKLELDKYFLIHLKPQFFTNETIKINWNRGTLPVYPDLKIQVVQLMGNMTRVVGVCYDPVAQKDLSNFWGGWIPNSDIEIKQKL